MSQESTDHFTGDQHHGHELMMRLRGFSSVRDMEDALIENHNAVVRRHDRVFHVGDMFFRCEPKRKRAILEKLHGQHFLIIGNHEDADTLSMKFAGPPQQYMLLKSGGARLFLAHLAHRVWYGQTKGALHLFGHSHGRIPADSLSCDVGVDAWAMFPTTVPQITARLAMSPAHVAAETEDGPDLDNTSGGLKP